MRLIQGRALASVLAAGFIVITAVVVYFVMGRGPGDQPLPERADKLGETVVGKAVLQAKDADCRLRLNQVRQVLQVAVDPVEGTAPASLDEARVPAELQRCPVGNEVYAYDPASANVGCSHPGHERY